MGKILIFAIIGIAIIATLGFVIDVVIQFFQIIFKVIEKLVVPNALELSKPVLEVSRTLEDSISRVNNKYFKGVDSKYYTPTTPTIVFTPSSPIAPIDTPRFISSPFSYTLNSGVVPNVITVEQVVSLHTPYQLDDFALGKLHFTFEGSGEFNPPKPPESPPLQQMYPVTKVDLPEPVLNLPEIKLAGIKGFLFNGILRSQTKNKYAKEILQFNDLIKKREAVIVQHEKWNKDIDISNQALVQKYNTVKKQYDDALTAYQREADTDSKKRSAECEQQNKRLQAIRQEYQSLSKEGIETYLDLILKWTPLPSSIPKNWKIGYSADNRIVIIDYQFPVLDKLEIVKLVERVKSKEWKPVNKTERKDLIPQIHPPLALRIAYEIARYDDLDSIDAIVVNGWVRYSDKVTGQTKETYCSSLFAKKTDMLAMNMIAIDPVKSFQAFKGRSSGIDSYDIAPITPILTLDMEDKRFVDAREVLETINKDENIATMNWEDFEHLVRELFERLFAQHGAEVKVTQASRDLGVDAVIFDPTPIKGGKTVIQAKRYVNIVDVSAVRDLFGTVMNEGANKGILVTTSYYGPESYEFAKDKPLELINGQQLLGLLEQHGYKFKINLEEARAFNKEQTRIM